MTIAQDCAGVKDFVKIKIRSHWFPSVTYGKFPPHRFVPHTGRDCNQPEREAYAVAYVRPLPLQREAGRSHRRPQSCRSFCAFLPRCTSHSFPSPPMPRKNLLHSQATGVQRDEKSGLKSAASEGEAAPHPRYAAELFSRSHVPGYPALWAMWKTRSTSRSRCG